MKDWFQGRDVAIIGNAWSLFDREYGNQIDQHEVVVRLNRGVLELDLVSQGSKIDVWAYAEEKLIEDLYDLVPCRKTMHMSRKGRKVKVEGQKKKQWEGHPMTAYYYPWDCLEELKLKLGHERPSSGLMVLDHVYSCEPKKVSLYGFDWKMTPTWYYQEPTTEHGWDIERKYVFDNYGSREDFKVHT